MVKKFSKSFATLKKFHQEMTFLSFCQISFTKANIIAMSNCSVKGES